MDGLFPDLEGTGASMVQVAVSLRRFHLSPRDLPSHDCIEAVGQGEA